MHLSHGIAYLRSQGMMYHYGLNREAVLKVFQLQGSEHVDLQVQVLQLAMLHMGIVRQSFPLRTIDICELVVIAFQDSSGLVSNVLYNMCTYNANAISTAFLREYLIGVPYRFDLLPITCGI
jgi:hypothetical protein